MIEPRSSGRKSVTLAVLIVGIVVGSALGSVIGYTLASRNGQAQSGPLSQQVAALQGRVDLLTSELNYSGQPAGNLTYASNLTQIYVSASRSIVVVEGIVSQTTVGLFGPSKQYGMVQGSGFVYYYEGLPYIVTNNHVVSGATNITITFEDGVSYAASVLGSDPYSDLAVLRAAGPISAPGLTIVPSSGVQVGEPVVAVGNPFGLAGSMTFGIVSQVGRTITESAANGYPIADVLQFSAPINPGNSGGPLLNSRGEVIGITTAEVSNSQGLGFAIPSNTIIRELPSLIQNGSYDMHPYLGISGTDMTPYIASAAGINVTYGWLVENVVAGGPAARAGIRAGNTTIDTVLGQVTVGGDIILAINGTRVTSGDVLSSYLEENALPGQTVMLTVWRAGSLDNVYVTLGIRPAP
ncbi:MAG: trypsin-like peptidase domain-containing protein [Nitrososphaerota archaeon]|nr:trypsin-like peptidase domain-containing protein [Nitrososphaerota archaeon]